MGLGCRWQTATRPVISTLSHELWSSRCFTFSKISRQNWKWHFPHWCIVIKSKSILSLFKKQLSSNPLGSHKLKNSTMLHDQKISLLVQNMQVPGTKALARLGACPGDAWWMTSSARTWEDTGGTGNAGHAENEIKVVISFWRPTWASFIVSFSQFIDKQSIDSVLGI